MKHLEARQARIAGYNKICWRDQRCSKHDVAIRVEAGALDLRRFDDAAQRSIAVANNYWGQTV